MNKLKSNEVVLDARLVEEPQIQTEFGVEKIYRVDVACKRKNGKEDRFTVNYSSGLNVELHENDYISLTGDLRSIKLRDDESKASYTKIYIMANRIAILEEEPKDYRNNYEIYDGVLKRDAKLRKNYNDDTIDITELVVKVKRGINKESTISCTAWNNIARLTANLKEGTRIKLKGRLQSHLVQNGSYLVEISVITVDTIK